MTFVNILPTGGELVPLIGLPFVFDAVVSIEHSGDAEPTRFPVEGGAQISDHVFVKPFSVSMSGIVSAFSSEPGVVNPFRLVDFSFQLEALRTAGEPITVITEDDVFLNMIVSSVRRREDVKQGRVYAVDVTCKNITIANAVAVNIPPIIRPPKTVSPAITTPPVIPSVEAASAAVAATELSESDTLEGERFEEAFSEGLVNSDTPPPVASLIEGFAPIRGTIAKGF